MFTYVARDVMGNVVRGEEEVETEDALVRALQRKQLYVVKVKAKGGAFSANQEIELPEWLGGGSVSRKEKTVFTRQLGTIMHSGVSIVSAMEALELQAKTAAMRRLIRSTRELIETGVPVGEAFADREDLWGELYVNLVRAGDATGTLPQAMAHLAGHLERSGTIAARIKSALTYPTVVFVIALGVAGFLLTQIVPQFAEILIELDADLPRITEVMLALSDFLVTNPVSVGLIVLSLLAFVVLTYRWEAGKYVYHLLFARLPVVKLLFKGSSVAGFASAFAAGLQSGLPVLDALEVAQRVVGNRVMRRSLDRVRTDVSRGEPVSRAMRDFPGVYPPVFVSMLRSGEDAGNVEVMVTHAQKYFQEEVDTTVDNLTSLIEPIMIVVLGGIIAVIVLSLFLPLWEAMSALGD